MLYCFADLANHENPQGEFYCRFGQKKAVRTSHNSATLTWQINCPTAKTPLTTIDHTIIHEDKKSNRKLRNQHTVDKYCIRADNIARQHFWNTKLSDKKSNLTQTPQTLHQCRQHGKYQPHINVDVPHIDYQLPGFTIENPAPCPPYKARTKK
jgi:hypothetical protein